MRRGRTRNTVLAVLLAVVMLVGLVPAAGANPRSRHLAELNSELWRTLLSIPGSVGDTTHPFNVAGCERVDHVLAPFEGGSVPEFSCRVEHGVPVLVSGYTLEWSAVEEPGADKSEARLRAVALQQLDAQPVPTVRLDGQLLRLTRVAGNLTTVALPPTNLLGAPQGPTTFVAAGLVTLVRPSRGCHAITIKTPPADPTKPDAKASFIITYLQVGRNARCDLDDANPR